MLDEYRPQGIKKIRYTRRLTGKILFSVVYRQQLMSFD